MTLSEKQRVFTRYVGLLIAYIYEQGYEATFGEAWRPKETAAVYAEQGKGIKDSLHERRLAVDLNLFKSGQYLPNTEDYAQFGTFWKKLTGLNSLLECSWGGDFKGRPDGNHFSIADGGQK